MSAACWVHPCSTSTSGAFVGRRVGTYRYIFNPPGLLPNDGTASIAVSARVTVDGLPSTHPPLVR